MGGPGQLPGARARPTAAPPPPRRRPAAAPSPPHRRPAASPPPRPRAAQVGPEQLRRQQRELLSAQELEYARSAGGGAVERARTVSRALLRSTLARYLLEAPQSLQFQLNPHGKPGLAHPGSLGRRLQFNMTHTQSVVGEGAGALPGAGWPLPARPPALEGGPAASLAPLLPADPAAGRLPPSRVRRGAGPRCGAGCGAAGQAAAGCAQAHAAQVAACRCRLQLQLQLQLSVSRALPAAGKQLALAAAAAAVPARRRGEHTP